MSMTFTRSGLDFADKVIDPAFNDFVKEVVPTYRSGRFSQAGGDPAEGDEEVGDNLSRYHIIVMISTLPTFASLLDMKGP